MKQTPYISSPPSSIMAGANCLHKILAAADWLAIVSLSSSEDCGRPGPGKAYEMFSAGGKGLVTPMRFSKLKEKAA
jgi:hypothetical protein